MRYCCHPIDACFLTSSPPSYPHLPSIRSACILYHNSSGCRSRIYSLSYSLDDPEDVYQSPTISSPTQSIARLSFYPPSHSTPPSLSEGPICQQISILSASQSCSPAFMIAASNSSPPSSLASSQSHLIRQTISCDEPRAEKDDDIDASIDFHCDRSSATIQLPIFQDTHCRD